MGMGTGGDDPSEFGTTMSEINVAPLVDVMLVLLIIFMVTSSVETLRAEQEVQRIRQEIVDDDIAAQHPSQKVPINMPKVNAEEVNLNEEQKLVLTMTRDPAFYIGETLVVRCDADAPGASAQRAAKDPAARFKRCLNQLEKKLLSNEKLQKDGEIYLRADRAIPYGQALTVMARIRKAGITRFGLVAEPDLEQ